MAVAIEFRDGQVDRGDGAVLAQAMRDEIAVIYPGLELDGERMPKAGPAELSPPGGAFLVGYREGVPVSCGGVKQLGPEVCELKRMYLVPELGGQGVARQLLVALEARARSLGYAIARLDTGPAQHSASFWGEKALG